MVEDRRAEYFERAAVCEENAAKAATPLAREVWTEAAATWKELTALKELLIKIERIYPDTTETRSQEIDSEFRSR